MNTTESNLVAFLNEFLESKSIRGVKVINGLDWKGKYGKGSLATLNIEGSTIFYNMFNFGENPYLLEELCKDLELEGYYYEMGTSCTVHIYGIPT